MDSGRYCQQLFIICSSSSLLYSGSSLQWFFFTLTLICNDYHNARFADKPEANSIIFSVIEPCFLSAK